MYFHHPVTETTKIGDTHSHYTIVQLRSISIIVYHVRAVLCYSTNDAHSVPFTSTNPPVHPLASSSAHVLSPF